MHFFKDKLKFWSLGRGIDITESFPFENPGESIVEIQDNYYSVSTSGKKEEESVSICQRGFSAHLKGKITEFAVQSGVQASFGVNVGAENTCEISYKSKFCLSN